MKKYDPKKVLTNYNCMDAVALSETGDLQADVIARYGARPFSLKTLTAARKALLGLKPKELSRCAYIHGPVKNPECCMLGAFAVGETITTVLKPVEDCCDGPVFEASDRQVRKYLIEAKHHNPRTVDALEFVNQHGSGALISDRSNYTRMLKWINKEIKRATPA